MKRLLLTIAIFYGIWWMWGEAVQITWKSLRWMDMIMLVILIILVPLIILARLRNRAQMRELERNVRENSPQVNTPAQPQVLMLPPGYGGVQTPPSTPKQATWTDLPPDRYETL